VSWFRRKRRSTGDDGGGIVSLGDGEAPGGWDGPDGIDPFSPPHRPAHPRGEEPEVGVVNHGTAPDGPSRAEDEPDVAGPDVAAPDLAEPPDSAGPDSAGPDSAGPDSAARDSAGPDSAGADIPGRQIEPQARRRPRRRGGRRRSGRIGALTVLAAALVLALLGDHLLAQRANAQVGPPVPAAPSLAPPGSLSSSWFCPALPAAPGSAALGRIIVANPGATPLPFVATFARTPAGGAAITVSRVLAPYTRAVFKLEEAAPSPYTATTVTIDGAGGAVEQEVDGALGASVTPCSSASSDHWYFAAGRTDTDATMLVSLYNPFPVEAIADLRFATDQGPTTPDAYQGVVVPARGSLVLNIGDRVRIRSAIATTVTVRAGRLIADKLQTQTAASGAGPKGLSLTLGATGPGQVWYYPGGDSGNGANEHFEIYNPGKKEAQVDLVPFLQSGSADPFQISVPPGDRVSLQVSQQARIPPGIQQSWLITSTNGISVVAERIVEWTPPAAVAGITDTVGAPRTSTRWVFPAGAVTATADEHLVLMNPGAVPATVRVLASGAGHVETAPVGPAPVIVAPSGRTVLHVQGPAAIDPVVLDVVATAPIVAERVQNGVGVPGASSTIGIAGP